MLGWKRQKYSNVPTCLRARLPLLPGASMTFHAPPRSVAVWATKSPFVHSIVSPTLAEISTGAKTRFLIATVMTVADAEPVLTVAATARTAANAAILPQVFDRMQLTSTSPPRARRAAHGPGR